MSYADTPPTQPKMIPWQVSAEYDQRYEHVLQALTTYPIVCLTGGTGVGKTHFVSKQWQTAHPHCHYDEDHLLDWILDVREGIKTLFIDEANLTHRDWSLFTGLFETKPGIFYRGQYYQLTSEHKVIFAGNPQSYGGERHTPSLFLNYPITIEFNPLPKKVLLHILQVEDDVAEAILSMIADSDCITPRELLMMAALTKAAIKTYPETEPAQWGRYFAYLLIKPHASASYLVSLMGKVPLSPLTLPNNIGELIVNKSNQEAICALFHHLNVRRLRQERDLSIPPVGGLGGIVLEGEPGVGKSMLIVQCLQYQGLEENKDYHFIPASLNTKDKEFILLDAFFQGKIVIIDEINSAPMPERLLNALLEGCDLEGKPALIPGFMLIGSQNPITYKGRIQTTLPLKHRLHTICLGDNTIQDLHLILSSYQLPPRIASDMIQEFKTRQAQNPKLCTRDLLKNAKHWPGTYQSAAVELAPLKQVGQICKIVAIANIESYYAHRFNYSPMPLHARKQPVTSIRKLAKQLGSAQGEILEFERWQQTIEALGFETEAVRFNQDEINRFVITIQNAIQQNHLPLIAFALDKSTGHPDPHPQKAGESEHAAVIIGYNANNDELTIAHWGNIYQVDLVSLFHSNQALPTTRDPEYYRKNQAYQVSNKDYEHKYVADKKLSDRNSIIPKPNTGFKGALLIVKEPSPSLLVQREKNLYQLIGPLRFFNPRQNQTSLGSPESMDLSTNEEIGSMPAPKKSHFESTEAPSQSTEIASKVQVEAMDDDFEPMFLCTVS